jgi:hypothetical protein
MNMWIFRAISKPANWPSFSLPNPKYFPVPASCKKNCQSAENNKKVPDLGTNKPVVEPIQPHSLLRATPPPMSPKRLP